MSLAVNTYEGLMARHKALEEQVLGSIIKEPTSHLASDKYRETFNDFLRGGEVTNSLKAGTDSGGGFLIPDSFEKKLVDALTAENVIRQISHVIKTKYDLKIPGVSEKGQASWVDETGCVEESDYQFNQIILRAYKIATLLKISDELLEDAHFDIEQFVCDSFALRFGKAEEETFLIGDGDKKPLGLLNDPSLSVIIGSSAKIDIDDVIDLMSLLSTRYHKNAVWLMNSTTHSALYKIKSARGQNIWEPAISEPAPMKLLGYPVKICDYMPDVAPGSKPILFGDFSYFLIGDRGNRSLKRLNELFAAEGQVGIVASQRVDAKLVLPDAIKCLQIKE